MFYLPGSWHVGSVLQWFINLWLAIEFWPFHLMDPLEWDDRERRGAGSLFIVLVLVVAIVVGALILTGKL
jgi:hypothetical protein